MRRTELKRKTPLRATSWKVSKKPRKALPKVNVKQVAKRKTKQRKHYASAEYKAARDEARQRSGGQCEVIHAFDANGWPIAVLLPGEEAPKAAHRVQRCPLTMVDTPLHFHEEDYGSDLGIIRAIKGFIACPHDHAWIERTRHPTRRNGR